MTDRPPMAQMGQASGKQKTLLGRYWTMTTGIKDRQRRTRADLLAIAFAISCTAAILPAGAADVSHDRLLKADSEPGNWLLHHKNFSAHRFSSLMRSTATP